MSIDAHMYMCKYIYNNKYVYFNPVEKTLHWVWLNSKFHLFNFNLFKTAEKYFKMIIMGLK